MIPSTTRFIEPLDVLFLRGNKLFGDPGSYGDALVPPWPSTIAGALRSRLLADEGVDLTAFARGEFDHPHLGTPARPGPFVVTAFHLARRHGDGRVEPLMSLPADLVVSQDATGGLKVQSLNPTPLTAGTAGLATSAPFRTLPVLAAPTRDKPLSGFWLDEAGWRAYLAGRTPAPANLVGTRDLWALDPRVGVGLENATGRAADGKLFTVQAVAMVKRGHPLGSPADEHSQGPRLAAYDLGFVATVTGAALPRGGTLRLGGDGRAAAMSVCETRLPEPDYEALASGHRCRLVLTTPGIFGSPPADPARGEASGWLPPGIRRQEDGGYRFTLGGVRARLTCAAVPRAEVISGWDLAHWRPKPAQRAVPAGAVYWLEELDATPEDLRKLVTAGLWDPECHDAQRRTEGFNRFSFAAY